MVKARIDSDFFFLFGERGYLQFTCFAFLKSRIITFVEALIAFCFIFFNFFSLVVSLFRVIFSWNFLEMILSTTSQCHSPGTSFPDDWGLSEILVKGERSAWPLPSHCLCAVLYCDVLCVSCACVHVHACTSAETGDQPQVLLRSHSLPFETGSLIGLEIINQTRLASQ